MPDNTLLTQLVPCNSGPPQLRVWSEGETPQIYRFQWGWPDPSRMILKKWWRDVIVVDDILLDVAFDNLFFEVVLVK